MRRAAIVSPVRTPSGVDRGALFGLSPAGLATAVLDHVVERSGIDRGCIEDVALAGVDGTALAGLALPGFVTDRRCGSGLQALITAAMMVQTGAADVVVAGGVESASRPVGPDRKALANAEALAHYYGIGRFEADEFTVASHRKAARAWRQGIFANEMVSAGRAAGPGGRLDHMLTDSAAHRILRDEGVIEEISAQTLGMLEPMLPDGVVTVANMSSHRHGAAGCLVVAEDRLEDLGLRPIAFLTGWAAAGTDTRTATLGAAPAVAKLLGRTGLTLDDMDLVEINEGFAVEVLALAREWELDPRTRLNVNGSALALGHPVGATGLRIMTTMLHELARGDGRYALEVIGLGPDHGIAALFESARTPPVVETPRGARFHGARPTRFGRHRA
ncbi:acetyl-CoA acetyltransferase [Nocardia sp. NPDC050712]|uniref:thiolase family protein n=1 Tax=Nocardia sp. NPDC050712 TaxID=3155518 RepID=UPI0034057B0C